MRTRLGETATATASTPSSRLRARTARAARTPAARATVADSAIGSAALRSRRLAPCRDARGAASAGKAGRPGLTGMPESSVAGSPSSPRSWARAVRHTYWLLSHPMGPRTSANTYSDRKKAVATAAMTATVASARHHDASAHVLPGGAGERREERARARTIMRAMLSDGTRRAPSPKPRLQDGLGEVPAVLEALGLLRLPPGPGPYRHRHLGDAGVLAQALQEDLRRPELVLLEDELAQGLRARGSIAVGDVGDAHPRHQRHDPREEADAEVTDVALLVELPEDAGALHHVDLIAQDRGHDRGELPGHVLAVGVHGGHDDGAEPQRELVADPEGKPAAATNGQPGDEPPGALHHVGRAIGGGILDDQRNDGDPPDGAGHGPDHVADVLGLVVGRHDHDDAVSVRQRLRFLPIERMRAQDLDEQAEVPGHQVGLPEIAQHQREQQQVRQQQEAEEPLPASATEVEHFEHRVDDVGQRGHEPDAETHRPRDEQVQPADATPPEADRGRDEKDGGEGAADDAKGDQPTGEVALHLLRVPISSWA